GVETQIVARKRHLEDVNENSENALGNGNNFDKIAFGSAGGYDTDVYGSVRGQRKNDYLTSINAGDEEEDAEDELVGPMAAAKAAYSAPKRFVEEAARHGKGDDPFAETRTKTIAERQSNYQARARHRQISPERADMFADQTPDIRDRSYAQIMKEQMLREETDKVEKELADKAKSGELKITKPAAPVQKKGRWDETPKIEALGAGALTPSQTPGSTQRKRLTLTSNISAAAAEVATPRVARWDETPAHAAGVDATPTSGAKAWDATPSTQTPRRNRWDETPHESVRDGMTPSAREGMTPGWGAETPRDARAFEDVKIEETPSESKRRSRWDLTPSAATPVAAATPSSTHMAGGATPSGFTPSGAGMTPSMMTPGGATPIGTPAMGLKTPIMPMVIDRVLYKLDDLVRPYVHKILVVIEPLLIDEDYYARVEGREIISNLAKAAGLATMISTMRPDIDNVDEYVRNTTARAFAVVASALGIPALLPFLKAVCKSKKSWQARHTGIKIVQQMAILMGCAVLPHLRSLVEIVETGLVDDQQKVRTITALCLAALAEAATPYGIEAFDSVLKPLWKGIRSHRGKGLAAFLKAIGFLIPLMDAEYASYYTREVMLILIREFASPDEEMKKIVLKDAVMLDGFGTVCKGLGRRTKPYLPQICGTILWRLNNKSAKVRQQAADLIAKLAPVMNICQEEKLMGHLGVVLYEYLGEEYPEVLGSILGALKAIVNVIGMTKMTPPIKDLLPRLTPILKNRHEKVQENCIDLVGRIADRGSEFVSAREWMRICFELLELLKAHKKSIRRAAINTFGYIAKGPTTTDEDRWYCKRRAPSFQLHSEEMYHIFLFRDWMIIFLAIGPHDVLATLLNNLKVQERQLRVCTTVAIAIVAETCAPFTVLPAIMNEYRVPEINVQNGVLKALSFMFE
ncbi:hypothetical protein X798_07128, partial [Onchocerca flexuosa]